MSTLLIKNARYIVSCDDRDTLYERCNLFIRDNAVEYIGPEARQAEQVIDASDMASSTPTTTFIRFSPATSRRSSGWSCFPGW